jgi:curli production assembly/transport component CsgG
MTFSRSKLTCVVAAVIGLSGCAAGSANDPLAGQATLVPDTKSGVVLTSIPLPVQALDVSVYSFPDLTGQNKENDNFAQFSRAVTQGGAAILTDVLTKAGGGNWFNVVERNELPSLLQERQIIQNTRVALYGKKAESLPALRFAGIMLQGGVIGYDTNETTGGAGGNWLGIGGSTQYRRDVVTVALRAVSVQTGRVLASVTTTDTVYSVQLQSSTFKYLVVNQLLQAELGFTRNSPVTLAVREGIELAVYALIFDGVKHDLWKFKNQAAGAAFMKQLDDTGRAVDVAPEMLATPGAPTAMLEASPGPLVASLPQSQQPAAATPAPDTATASLDAPKPNIATGPKSSPAKASKSSSATPPKPSFTAAAIASPEIEAKPNSVDAAVATPPDDDAPAASVIGRTAAASANPS